MAADDASPDQRFEPNANEPLCYWARPAALGDSPTGARTLRFELSSRGDRVPGLLHHPETRAPAPLILLCHGGGGSKDAPYMACSRRWVAGGAAVASIDLPLCGERSSAKLSERLLAEAIEWIHAEPSTDAPILVDEFIRQSVLDWRRTLDALSELPEIDANRVAFGGFSLGGILGAMLCAVEPRIRAAVLAIAGSTSGGPGRDPAEHIAALAPRRLLMLNMEQDERIPRAASEALFRAAAEPKAIEWYPGGHRELPGTALKSMWRFFRSELGLPEPG